MDMQGEGKEGAREEETMVWKEDFVLLGFYLGMDKTLNIINTSPSYPLPHSGAKESLFR